MSSPEDIQKLAVRLLERQGVNPERTEGFRLDLARQQAKDTLELVESIGYVSEDKHLEGNNDHYWTGHEAGFNEAHIQKRNGW